MELKKDDRRVKYTKKILKQTLIELMQRQSIDKISVKELCEVADVSRSTFYAHYSDQYDLLSNLEKEIFQEINEYIAAHNMYDSELWAPLITHVLEYARENAEILRVLLSENGDKKFQLDVMLLAQQKMIMEIYDSKRLNAELIEYLKLFATSGAISIVRKWLEGGVKEPPEKIADLISNLMYRGVSSFYSPN